MLALVLNVVAAGALVASTIVIDVPGVLVIAWLSARTAVPPLNHVKEIHS